MDDSQIARLGDALHEALASRSPIAPLSAAHADLGLDDAYRIQAHMVGRRIALGERIVGRKIGVTSRAVMDKLGVRQPDFGTLLDGMVVRDGQAIDCGRLIQPRAEGEIAFHMKHDLTGPGVCAADVLAATGAVSACFEIIDSRIRDWQITITDTVADNASSGVFVLGADAVDPRDVDLVTCGMVLEKNDEIVGTGAGAASMGSPLNAMVWLVNTLGRLGVGLRAGEVVLSGSLSTLIPVQAGDRLRVRVGGIGACAVRFV